MYLVEQKCIGKSRPDEKPPQGGFSIVSKIIDNRVPQDIVTNICDVWLVIASWGRWNDEDLGDRPSVSICMEQLPSWFSSELESRLKQDVQNWFDALHERSWIWWSSSIHNEHFKIDLYVDGAFPISTWVLESVIESTGSAIVSKGPWKNSNEIISMLSDNK